MQTKNPEDMARAVVEACADCDICRYLMESTSCKVFPELYRLFDKEAAKTGRITPAELKGLVDLCNFCALCPCPNIRGDLMKAKHAFVDRDGLDRSIRLLEDIGRISGICGVYPRVANILFQGKRSGAFLKRLTGIHPARKLPEFPVEDFDSWAERQGLHKKHEQKKGRKVAYFPGCTGRYLFPEVPKAAVEVLRRNGIDVFVPEQKCCGMPSLLEGDMELTLDFCSFNLDRLCEAVDSGYQIVCSCPTCGYMLKHVISEGAFYAREYRESTDRSISAQNRITAPGQTHQAGADLFNASVMDNLFRDEGYFASLNALKRIKVANNTCDLGEYLRELQRNGDFNEDLSPLRARAAYYPPCHLREQKIGEPYADLLALVPGLEMERIDGAFHCCGIAGIMGFKKNFYQVSIEMGRRLMDKITSIHPERLLTDCLSCRIQFNQLLPYRVYHPIEILCESYQKNRND